MSALAQMGIVLLAAPAVGWLAHRTQQHPRLGKMLGAGAAIIILLTLAWSILTGEFLRFAPGADSDPGYGEDHPIP
ncbi:hypothetical protein [Novosphingobium sp. FKTRR1]|uniref:hypothetical protein n=1 Tax=Novosphingobium sp. FKTRR1 TaxID=2879118 RepID=UPI001CF096E7|nr:hypothetical protein [Novosphingobium sp. FKTRR1]